MGTPSHHAQKKKFQRKQPFLLTSRETGEGTTIYSCDNGSDNDSTILNVNKLMSHLASKVN